VKELDKIENILHSFGCISTRESMGTLDMLQVVALSQNEKLLHDLVISIYPKEDEEDEMLFVQFYFQFPIDAQTISCTDLIQKNKQMPLGHFNLVPDEDYGYYKYVLVSSEDSIDANLIKELLSIISFLMEEMAKF
jgi:hypothetical protein